MRQTLSSVPFRSIAVGIVAACGLASQVQAQCSSNTVNQLWGEAQVVKVRSGVAYLGYDGRLQLMNVLNPAIPISLGKAAFSGTAEELHLDGNYVYIAAGHGGLVIVDVSSTASPVVVGTLDVGKATDIAVSNSTAFVAADSDAKIVDVTNPAAPVLASTYEHSWAWVDSIASSGSTFYVCNTTGTVDAVDASNRASPVLLDTIETSSSIGEDLVLRGNTLAVIAWDSTTLVNITNPAAMTSSSVLPNEGINRHGAISVDGGVTRIHYGYDDTQIRTYDITNPAAPILQSTIAGFASTHQLTTSAGDLYELGSGDVRVLDFANPASPVELATIEREPVFPDPLVISGSTALYGDGNELYAMNVAVPTAPTVPVLVYTSAADDIVDLVIEGSRLYLASEEFSGDSRIEILDITNPAAPTPLGGRTIPAGPESMGVLDSRVFVLDETDTLRILDASVANAVTEEGSIDLSGEIGFSLFSSVHPVGGLVFVGHEEGVPVVNVSRPWAPTLVTTLLPRSGEYVETFVMRGNTAFVAQSDDLIEALDVSDPMSPVLLDSIPSPDGIDEMGMVDSLLFVYDYADQLNIVDTTDPADIALVSSQGFGGEPEDFARRANTLWTSSFKGVYAVALPDFPRITAWPEDQALCAGTPSVAFSVTVGNNAGATYQWQRNGLNVLDGAAPGGATFAGATTSTLTITNPSLGQLGEYVCVISKGCGVTMTEPASLYFAVPPTIALQPQSQTICRRDGVSFSVAGIVTPPVTYRWQYETPVGSGVWTNVEDGPTQRMVIEGSRERVLTITAQPGQTIPNALGTNYRVTVTNACREETSNSALLTLTGACCDSIDFNNDGSLFDPTDIDAFLSVFSEGPCIPGGATCNDVDFNNDTSLFDPCDIDSFLLVFSEGPCTGCGG
jgi:hypothetical protein